MLFALSFRYTWLVLTSFLLTYMFRSIYWIVIFTRWQNDQIIICVSLTKWKNNNINFEFEFVMNKIVTNWFMQKCAHNFKTVWYHLVVLFCEKWNEPKQSSDKTKKRQRNSFKQVCDLLKSIAWWTLNIHIPLLFLLLLLLLSFFSKVFFSSSLKKQMKPV